MPPKKITAPGAAAL
jgi:hypothetical protein